MKSTSKILQITVFVILIFVFIFNHYRLNKSCKETEKTFSIILKTEIYMCKKYEFWPNSIVLKSNPSSRIPADLISLFIGAGIFYFTKNNNNKFNK